MINPASKANRILKSGTFQPDSERMPPKVSQPVRTTTQPFRTIKTGGSNPAKFATESRSNFRWISDNRGCRGSKSRNHDKTTNRRNAHEIKDCRACGSNSKRWSVRWSDVRVQPGFPVVLEDRGKRRASRAATDRARRAEVSGMDLRPSTRIRGSEAFKTKAAKSSNCMR